MNLYLPNTPFDSKADRRYGIVSEFGPQSINIDKTPDLLNRLRSMKRVWGAVAHKIHPSLEVEVTLSIE